MYQYNKELSERIARIYKGVFRVKRCYENVYFLTNRVKELTPSKDMRILFCYAINELCYYRHAFCVFQGGIIEPLKNVSAKLDVARIIPIKDMTVEEYYTLILADKRYDLVPSLSPLEIEIFNAHPILMNELNPVDMSDLVQRAVKDKQDTNSYLRIFADIQAGRGIHA